MTDLAICPRCGRIHQRDGRATCAGHRSSITPLTPCTRWPLDGADKCVMHGNGTKAARAKAAHNVALGEATHQLERLGRPIETTATVAMTSMVCEAAGNVAFYRARVQDLDHLIAGPDAEDVLAALGGGGKEGEKIKSRAPTAIYGRVDPRNWKAERHVLVGLYNDERELLMRFSKMCRDCGVDEARIELEVEQGRQLAEVLRATVNALLSLVIELAATAGHDEFVGTLRAVWSERVPALVRHQIETIATKEINP